MNTFLKTFPFVAAILLPVAALAFATGSTAVAAGLSVFAVLGSFIASEIARSRRTVRSPRIATTA